MSSPSDDELDLVAGLPVHAGDVEALRRHRPGGLSSDEYLSFLRQLPQPTYEELRRRRGPSGPPFRLPDEPGDDPPLSSASPRSPR